ncbi:hypothetical protein F5050DRAFT_1723916, partial [Lentinula boryana]
MPRIMRAHIRRPPCLFLYLHQFRYSRELKIACLKLTLTIFLLLLNFRPSWKILALLKRWMIFLHTIAILQYLVASTKVIRTQNSHSTRQTGNQNLFPTPTLDSRSTFLTWI